MDISCSERLPQDRPWVIKAGFDPTTADLHLGHAVLLRALRQWQQQGHQVVMIVGDFTATLGDPTGRNTTRPVLTPQQVQENAQSYLDQAMLILDPSRTQVVYNSSWLGKLSASDLIGLMQQFTVAQMTARSDFSQRLDQGTAVGLHELIYPLLQGFDSVHVGADLEVGGQDQLFNLMAGRVMQEINGQPPQAIAMSPLLVGLDGVRKMSKSYGNHVSLKDDPITMFGKTMSIPDTLVDNWAELLGISGVNVALDPYQAKRSLARGIVSWLHSPKASETADQDWETRFSKRQLSADMEEKSAPDGSTLPQILVAWGFASSLTVAKQKINEGAVRIDGEKVIDINVVPKQGVIQLGRRHVARLIPPPRHPGPTNKGP